VAGARAPSPSRSMRAYTPVSAAKPTSWPQCDRTGPDGVGPESSAGSISHNRSGSPIPAYQPVGVERQHGVEPHAGHRGLVGEQRGQAVRGLAGVALHVEQPTREVVEHIGHRRGVDRAELRGDRQQHLAGGWTDVGLDESVEQFRPKVSGFELGCPKTERRSSSHEHVLAALGLDRRRPPLGRPFGVALASQLGLDTPLGTGRAALRGRQHPLAHDHHRRAVPVPHVWHGTPGPLKRSSWGVPPSIERM